MKQKRNQLEQTLVCNAKKLNKTTKTEKTRKKLSSRERERKRCKI